MHMDLFGAKQRRLPVSSPRPERGHLQDGSFQQAKSGRCQFCKAYLASISLYNCGRSENTASNSHSRLGEARCPAYADHVPLMAKAWDPELHFNTALTAFWNVEQE